MELRNTTFQDDLFLFSTAWFTFFQRSLGQTKAIYIECHTVSPCPSTRSCPDCPEITGVTKEKAAAAWDWLPAPSAVGFGTMRGCLKKNWFQFYFVCAVSFLNSLCCNKVGNSRSHQAFSGTFRTQGKAYTSVKTLFQNLFIQLLFSNIQYSL